LIVTIRHSYVRARCDVRDYCRGVVVTARLCLMLSGRQGRWAPKPCSDRPPTGVSRWPEARRRLGWSTSTLRTREACSAHTGKGVAIRARMRGPPNALNERENGQPWRPLCLAAFPRAGRCPCDLGHPCAQQSTCSASAARERAPTHARRGFDGAEALRLEMIHTHTSSSPKCHRIRYPETWWTRDQSRPSACADLPECLPARQGSVLGRGARVARASC